MTPTCHYSQVERGGRRTFYVSEFHRLFVNFLSVKVFHARWKKFWEIWRRNRSCSAYFYTFLRIVVCLSVSVCRISFTFVHLLKPFDGFKCHLWNLPFVEFVEYMGSLTPRETGALTAQRLAKTWNCKNMKLQIAAVTWWIQKKISSVFCQINAVFTGALAVSDYINAVYVDSYTRRNRFIVTQTPLTSTVDDFLALICHHRIRSAAKLNSLRFFWRISLRTFSCQDISPTKIGDNGEDHGEDGRSLADDRRQKH